MLQTVMKNKNEQAPRNRWGTEARASPKFGQSKVGFLQYEILRLNIKIWCLTQIKTVPRSLCNQKNLCDNNPIWGKKLSKSNIVQQQQTTEVFFWVSFFCFPKVYSNWTEPNRVKKGPLEGHNQALKGYYRSVFVMR